MNGDVNLGLSASVWFVPHTKNLIEFLLLPSLWPCLRPEGGEDSVIQTPMPGLGPARSDGAYYLAGMRWI